MMYRHFDSTHTKSEVLVKTNFGWLNDCANENNTEEDIYFYHKDHLGSSTQITDREATVIHHIEYMSSGEQFAEQRSTWGTSYKFNGKELDQETGLYYYGARYYNPTLSIWGSVDPMSDKYPSMSPYMYCAGNPVILVDPNGKEIWTTAEGWAIMERAFNATLGEKNNPFTYNSETGKVEFNENKKIGELDDNQKEILKNYTSLVNDKDFNVCVSVVGNDDNIISDGNNITLRGEETTGLAILRDNKTVDVFLSRNPLKKNTSGVLIKSDQPQDDTGITSLHELGGHAYNWQQKVYGSQNNRNTESFERKARDAYNGYYQKNNIRNQSVQRHRD